MRLSYERLFVGQEFAMLISQSSKTRTAERIPCQHEAPSQPPGPALTPSSQLLVEPAHALKDFARDFRRRSIFVGHGRVLQPRLIHDETHRDALAEMIYQLLARVT